MEAAVAPELLELLVEEDAIDELALSELMIDWLALELTVEVVMAGSFRYWPIARVLFSSDLAVFMISALVW
jgi:hypothetical protein